MCTEQEAVGRALLAELGLDEQTLQQGVLHLTHWLSKQPHLPSVQDENLLRTFIVGSKSVERAKLKLDGYFTARWKYSALTDYTNISPPLREPQSMESVILPQVTDDGCRISFLRTTDAPTKNYDATANIIRMNMMGELLFWEETLTSKLIVLADAAKLSPGVITKTPLETFSHLVHYWQEISPIRMKQIIVFNAHPLAETFINTFVKPFCSKKMKERIHIFSGDHTVVKDFFPIRLMPKDYGGEESSYAEIRDNWDKILEKRKDWFKELSSLKADETLRPKSDQLSEFGIGGGTFRKLNVD